MRLHQSFFARAARLMRTPSATWGVHPFSKVVPIRPARRRFFAREMDRLGTGAATMHRMRYRSRISATSTGQTVKVLRHMGRGCAGVVTGNAVFCPTFGLGHCERPDQVGRDRSRWERCSGNTRGNASTGCLGPRYRRPSTASGELTASGLTRRNCSAHRILAVICMTTNSVTMQPMVTANPVKP